MSTALPCPELPPAPAAVVRTAGSGDVEAVRRLSGPFVREGSLRERTAAELALAATDFLVVEAGRGDLAGCVASAPAPTRGAARRPCSTTSAWRPDTRDGASAPRSRRRPRGGRRAGATRVFTATTGSGLLFLRYGFTPGGDEEAPPVWRASLDPARGSRILVRALG